MTQLEKEDWDELYQYIKKDIFEYTDQALPKYMILRLKGLVEGKFMANKYTKIGTVRIPPPAPMSPMLIPAKMMAIYPNISIVIGV